MAKSPSANTTDFNSLRRTFTVDEHPSRMNCKLYTLATPLALMCFDKADAFDGGRQEACLRGRHNSLRKRSEAYRCLLNNL